MFFYIRKYFTFLFCSTTVLLSFSCHSSLQKSYNHLSNKTLADSALLQAGDNRVELEKVINHYKALAELGENGSNQEGNNHQDINTTIFNNHSGNCLDSLKLEATYYLIANMPGKHTSAAVGENPFLKHFKQMQEIAYDHGSQMSGVSAFIDSVLQNSQVEFQQFPDLEHTTSDFLINNIDRAFAQWEKCPWRDDYTFEEFCEWVLPYRVGTEELEDWREIALTSKIPQEDSLLAIGDIKNLGINLINNNEIHFNSDYIKLPFQLSYSEMTQLYRGTCGIMTRFGAQLFRSRGIPVAEDRIPGWADRNSDHAWLGIILPDGKSHDLAYNYGGNSEIRHRVAKIYRKRFSVMRNDLLYKYRETEAIPKFFSDFNRQDVTAEYDMPVSDIEIKSLRKIDSKLAWLCTFNNSIWIPVAYAPVENRNKALFKDMGRGLLWRNAWYSIEYALNKGDGIVYLPAFYKHGGIIPAANPVILYSDGRIKEIIADTANLETVTLKRKYPKKETFIESEKSLIGSRIEAANKQDFSDAEVIFTVDRIMDNPLEEVSISPKKPYRYIRFEPNPGSENLKIAELKFYSDTTEIKGKILGKIGVQGYDARSLFDGDILTSFEATDANNDWAGLDFGEPKILTSLRLCAYTDDNEIVPGEKYQLNYWDNGWKEAGTQTVTGYTLEWEAPKGALLWLRNLSKGMEERIFTIENGEQIWW